MVGQNGFPIIYRLLKFLSYLRLITREFIINIICWICSVPQEFIPTILMFIRPTVFSKFVHLADDEMEQINETDYARIKENEHRLTFIYSTKDGLVPNEHYVRIVRQVPNAKVHITDKIEHSFIMKSSCEMAAIVGEWIQQNAV